MFFFFSQVRLLFTGAASLAEPQPRGSLKHQRAIADLPFSAVSLILTKQTKQT
jgi:hypothetical protein